MDAKEVSKQAEGKLSSSEELALSTVSACIRDLVKKGHVDIIELIVVVPFLLESIREETEGRLMKKYETVPFFADSRFHKQLNFLGI
jgi:hypothetical protein